MKNFINISEFDKMDIYKLNLSVYVTKDCNLDCSWCSFKLFKDEISSCIWTDVSFDLFEQFIKKHKDIIKLVCIIGGEPLLYPDICLKLIKILNKNLNLKNNSSIICHTNGYLLTDDLINTFNNYNTSINISLNYSGEKGLDNFINKSILGNKIFNSIYNIKSKTIRSVFTRKQKFADDMINLHKKFKDIYLYCSADSTELNLWDNSDISFFETEMKKIKEYDDKWQEWICITGFQYPNANDISYSISYLPNNILFWGWDSNNLIDDNLSSTLSNNVKLLTKLIYIYNKFKKSIDDESVLNNYSKNKKIENSINYQIITNTNCNLRCTYCYEKDKKTGKTNIEDIKAYLEALFKRDFEYANDIQKSVSVVIDLIGGETLLYPEILEEIANISVNERNKYNCTGKLIFSISTNGTQIANRKDVQDYLLKWKNNISIGMSIDGTKEIHDSCRIDSNGNGSYDSAIEGLKWLQANGINPGVKATYCHNTISKYAEGIINLIKLGFTEIAANTVFEESWTKEESPNLFEQLKTVFDYIYDNNLIDKIHWIQLNPSHNNTNIDFLTFFEPKASNNNKCNYCGACKYMHCLGQDGLVYGCSRFFMTKYKNPIGFVDKENKKIKIFNDKLKNIIENEWKLFPIECINCNYFNFCSFCAAIPFEDIYGIEHYINQKSQCGWTHALIALKLYARNKVLGISTDIDTEINN